MAHLSIADFPARTPLESVMLDERIFVASMETLGVALPGREKREDWIHGSVTVAVHNPPTRSLYTDFFEPPLVHAVAANPYAGGDELQVAWEKLVDRYWEAISRVALDTCRDLDTGRNHLYDFDREERMKRDAIRFLSNVSPEVLKREAFDRGVPFLYRLLPIREADVLPQLERAAGWRVDDEDGLEGDGVVRHLEKNLHEHYRDMLEELHVVLDTLLFLPWLYPECNYSDVLEAMAESWQAARALLCESLSRPYRKLVVPLASRSALVGAVFCSWEYRADEKDDFPDRIQNAISGFGVRLEERILSQRHHVAALRLSGLARSDDAKLLDAIVDLTGCRKARVGERYWPKKGGAAEKSDGQWIDGIEIERDGTTYEASVLPWHPEHDSGGEDAARLEIETWAKGSLDAAKNVPLFSISLLEEAVVEYRPRSLVMSNGPEMFGVVYVGDLLRRAMGVIREKDQFAVIEPGSHVCFALRPLTGEEDCITIWDAIADQVGVAKNERVSEFEHQFFDGHVEKYELHVGKKDYRYSAVTASWKSQSFDDLFSEIFGLRALVTPAPYQKNQGRVQIWRPEDDLDETVPLKIDGHEAYESYVSADLNRLGITMLRDRNKEETTG